MRDATGRLAELKSLQGGASQYPTKTADVR
jgi:hypothetical protein